MKTLTYQGLPVVRPSREQARQSPCCSLCQAPVIWVRDEWLGWDEPRCADPGCPSHLSREVLRITKVAPISIQEQGFDWSLLIFQLIMIPIAPPLIALILAAAVCGGCMYAISIPVRLIYGYTKGEDIWTSLL